MYDGYLNTYTFSNDTKKITFSPLSPSQLNENKLEKSHKHSDLFLTYSAPLLKASYHSSRDFKEWIFTATAESERAS